MFRIAAATRPARAQSTGARATAAGPCLRHRRARPLRPRGSRRDTVSSFLPAHVPNHAPPLALLAFRQFVAAAGERILAFAELDADRRAFQLVTLAEEVFEIAPVAVGDMFGTRAVDHDGGRIVAARMCEAQPRRMPAHQRRLMAADRLLQRARQIGSAEFARGGEMRAVHAAHQLAQARAVFRRDENGLGPGDEIQFAIESFADTLAP